jgi:hypothetical protein
MDNADSMDNVVDYSGLVYPATNESLEAIVKGLDIKEGDNVLAISGSGDQPFAILENASSVTGVDYNEVQHRFVLNRAEMLRAGQFSNFVLAGKSVEGCDIERNIERRKEYFSSNGRLQKISSKMNRFGSEFGDFYEIVERKGRMFRKLYLSNIMSFNKFDNLYWDAPDLKRIAPSVQPGTLVYLADANRIWGERYWGERSCDPDEETKKHWEVCQKLTQIARGLHTGYTFPLWVPTVLRRNTCQI